MRHSTIGEHRRLLGRGRVLVVQIVLQRKSDRLASKQKFQQSFLAASRQFSRCPGFLAVRNALPLYPADLSPNRQTPAAGFKKPHP
jgi:hypothetical protein